MKKPHLPRVHSSIAPLLYVGDGEDIHARVCCRKSGAANMLPSEKILIDRLSKSGGRAVNEVREMMRHDWYQVLQGGHKLEKLGGRIETNHYYRDLEHDHNSKVSEENALNFDNVVIWASTSSVIGRPTRGMVFSITGEKLFSFLRVERHEFPRHVYFFSKEINTTFKDLPEWVSLHYSFKDDCFKLVAKEDNAETGERCSGKVSELADFLMLGEQYGQPNLSTFHATPMSFDRTVTKEKFKIAIRKNPEELIKLISEKFGKRNT